MITGPYRSYTEISRPTDPPRSARAAMEALRPPRVSLWQRWHRDWGGPAESPLLGGGIIGLFLGLGVGVVPATIVGVLFHSSDAALNLLMPIACAGSVGTAAVSMALHKGWFVRPPLEQHIPGLSPEYLSERRKKGAAMLDRTPDGLSEAECTQQLIDSVTYGTTDQVRAWIPYADAKANDSLALRLAVVRCKTDAVRLLLPVSDASARDHEAARMIMVMGSQTDQRYGDSMAICFATELARFVDVRAAADALVREGERPAVRLLAERIPHIGRSDIAPGLVDTLNAAAAQPVRRREVPPTHPSAPAEERVDRSVVAVAPPVRSLSARPATAPDPDSMAVAPVTIRSLRAAPPNEDAAPSADASSAPTNTEALASRPRAPR